MRHGSYAEWTSVRRLSPKGPRGKRRRARERRRPGLAVPQSPGFGPSRPFSSNRDGNENCSTRPDRAVEQEECPILDAWPDGVKEGPEDGGNQEQLNTPEPSKDDAEEHPFTQTPCARSDTNQGISCRNLYPPIPAKPFRRRITCFWTAQTNAARHPFREGIAPANRGGQRAGSRTRMRESRMRARARARPRVRLRKASTIPSRPLPPRKGQTESPGQ